jgi:DNA-directed RNA polymerase specialized sigma24 family protein
MDPSAPDITQLLRRAQENPTDKAAQAAAYVVVRAVLFCTASAMLKGQPPDCSVGEDELVDTAFLRSIKKGNAVVSQETFRRYANEAMRNEIIDRARCRQKRRERERAYAADRGMKAVPDGSDGVAVIDPAARPDESVKEELYLAVERLLERLEGDGGEKAGAGALFRARYWDRIRWHLLPRGEVEPRLDQALSVAQAGAVLNLPRATAYRRWALFLEELQKDEDLRPLAPHLKR